MSRLSPPHGLRGNGLLAALHSAHRRLRSLARHAGDRLRDWIEGVETASMVEAKEIVTTSDNKVRGIRYQSSAVRPLRKVLRALRLPPGEVFVDIGSGKGRVLILALEFGFAGIVGVDYSPDLCAIAKRNLDVSRRRKRIRTPVLIQCCDAADYAFAENESVIYLFNPFDDTVLARLLQNLAASLFLTPRKLWLIYHFPRWHNIIEASAILRAAGVYRYGDDEFAIYLHEPR